MTDKRPLKPGQWVAVTYLAQVQAGGLIPIANGVAVPRDLLGDDIRITPYGSADPRPCDDPPVNDAALRGRIVDLEMQAATYRSDVFVAERERTRAERAFRKTISDQRDEVAAQSARVRLLTAMLRVDGDAGINSVATVVERALGDPCRAWFEHVVPDCGDGCCFKVERVDPCALEHWHHGDHLRLDGTTFPESENANPRKEDR